MDYSYKGHDLSNLTPSPHSTAHRVWDKDSVYSFLDYPNWWGAVARYHFLRLSPEDQLWIIDRLTERASRPSEPAGQQEHSVVMDAILRG